MRLTHYRVETEAALESLRSARNLCAGTFANDNHEITPGEQRAWWEQARRNTFAWVFTWFDGRTGLDYLAGFGLIKYKYEWNRWAWWTSVGVVPTARGHHFGEQITSYLVGQPVRPIYGVALLTNPAGIKLHYPDTWEFVEQDAVRALYRVKDDTSF